MAYISTAEVAQIRKTLKEKFPMFKFGVCKDGHTAVHVTIKSGPVDFSSITGANDYVQINHYHLHNYGAFADLFRLIIDVIKKAPAQAEGGREWFDESDSMTDYFHTAFYFHLQVGNWNKPYVHIPEKKKASKQKAAKEAGRSTRKFSKHQMFRVIYDTVQIGFMKREDILNDDILYALECLDKARKEDGTTGVVVGGRINKNIQVQLGAV